jgi:hypothetical protein
MSLLTTIMAIVIVIIAYSPVISYSLELRNEYLENREKLEDGDTKTLQEMLTNMTKDLVPETKEEVTKDIILEILEDIIFRKTRIKK